GISSPRVSRSGKELPNARLVSSTVHPDRTVPSPTFSHMLMQFGQFMDHDVALSPLEAHPGEIRNLGSEYNFFTILVSRPLLRPNLEYAFKVWDPWQGTLSKELDNMAATAWKRCILQFLELTKRTRWRHSDAISTSSRVGLHGLSYEDCATTNGQTQQRPQKYDRCEMVKKNLNQLDHADKDRESTECVELTQTDAVRGHGQGIMEVGNSNRAKEDAKLGVYVPLCPPSTHRRIVGAQWQHIAYGEWMPVVLGPDAMARYRLTPTGRSRYSPDVDASLLNEFATAAFRLGHTLIDGVFNRVTADGEASPYELQDFYFFPFYLYHGDMDNVVRGLLQQSSQDYDSFITVGVTQHLYRLRNESYGLDLIALNLQRGREHGLRPYVDYLNFCTGQTVTSFDDLLRYIPERVVNQYISLYE
ncbi:unnamed protein product, partial [Ixodes hexagonus]